MLWYIPWKLGLPGKQLWLQNEKQEGFSLLREGSECHDQPCGSSWGAGKPKVTSDPSQQSSLTSGSSLFHGL